MGESRNASQKIARRNAIAMGLSGLALGWMVGLSVSPVVEKVITGVLGLLLSVLAAFAGLKQENKESADGGMKSGDESGHEAELSIAPAEVNLSNTKSVSDSLGKIQVSLVPLALFTVLLAVGSTFGGLARINLLLGLRPAWVAKRFIPAQSLSTDTQHQVGSTNDKIQDHCSKGVDEACVYWRILDGTFPARSESAEKSAKGNASPPASGSPEKPPAGPASNTPPLTSAINTGAGIIENRPQKAVQCNEVALYLNAKNFEAAFNALEVHEGKPPSCGTTDEACLKRSAKQMGCGDL